MASVTHIPRPMNVLFGPMPGAMKEEIADIVERCIKQEDTWLLEGQRLWDMLGRYFQSLSPAHLAAITPEDLTPIFLKGPADAKVVAMQWMDRIGADPVTRAD